VVQVAKDAGAEVEVAVVEVAAAEEVEVKVGGAPITAAMVVARTKLSQPLRST